ncbi:Uncharacterized protein CPLU01_08911 [Colletotrichum plurivorum]|uniref:Copper acquisition factor BIM1-like domain-containing protein n=1 Tax=Colletotrichum plurivorum TaxID=2175906 RepID=A0A8H6KAH1_9PEZI|nr:Uncharacterized protein CPLU01_08911 [Colletotrichum plurivorum]
MARLLSLLLLASTATAHFSLSVPKPLGDSDDKQGTKPCGGYTASPSDAAVDFYIGGDAVGMENGHPQTNWLFRATLDQTASGNWTQVFPVVLQTGLGSFCEPSIVVPDDFAGKKGIIGVVAHSPDGLLYACAAVNFVNSPAPSRSECKNASITVDFTSDPSLSAIMAEGSAAATPGTSGSASSSTPTSSPSAASGLSSSLLTPGAVGSILVSVAAAVGGAAMFF